MKATKARTYWDEAVWPWQAAAILIALDIAGLAVTRFLVGTNIHGQIRDAQEHPVMAILGNWAIVTRILLVLAFAAYYYGRGTPPRAFGLTISGVRRRLREFGTSLAVILPLVGALSMISILVLRGIGRGDLITAPLHTLEPERTGAWIWIFVVALPPFEEFTYRGMLHPVLRRHMGVGGAVAIGGMLFGLLHWFYGIDLASLLAYGAGGAALAWVYERTGSLYFPWLLHVATNLAAVWISSYPGLFEALRR